MEPQSGSPPASPGTPSSPKIAKMPAQQEQEPGLKTDRVSSSSSSSSSSSEAECVFHVDVDEIGKPVVTVLAADEPVAPVDGAAEARPDDWASWPQQQPAQTVDGTGVTQAPEVQMMAQEPAAESDRFDPQRIPASIFQPKPGAASSQAEWSVASNESLFSIHGYSQSTDLGAFYTSSRSHFDYFYDEAMAAAGGAEPDNKLATVAEGHEPDSSGGHGSTREFASMPGSAMSDGSDRHKKAIAIRRHESGSGGSSSNFSFAFPILAETSTSPKKKDCVISALFQSLEKEYEQLPPPHPPPTSEFEEMTEEERKRKAGWCCCGECCGCCWFACSWPSCCCCCQWRWWLCCDCRCRCPSFCRCSWCLCF